MRLRDRAPLSHIVSCLTVFIVVLFWVISHAKICRVWVCENIRIADSTLQDKILGPPCDLLSIRADKINRIGVLHFLIASDDNLAAAFWHKETQLSVPNITASENLYRESWRFPGIDHMQPYMKASSAGRHWSELKYSDGDIGAFLYFKLLATCFQRCIGSVGGAFSGGSGFLKLGVLLNNLPKLTAHHFELTSVDTKGNYSNDGKDSVNYKLCALYPPKFPRKLSGGLLLIVGSIVRIWANFALWWSGWNHWRLMRRLTLGIGGWSIAVVFICHGARFLLGMN